MKKSEDPLYVLISKKIKRKKKITKIPDGTKILDGWFAVCFVGKNDFGIVLKSKDREEYWLGGSSLIYPCIFRKAQSAYSEIRKMKKVDSWFYKNKYELLVIKLDGTVI